MCWSKGCSKNADLSTKGHPLYKRKNYILNAPGGTSRAGLRLTWLLAVKNRGGENGKAALDREENRDTFLWSCRVNSASDGSRGTGSS